MRRARLTITELRNPAGHSHARRRLIAAVFGILALLTQAGFTLGAAAGSAAAEPGSLSADLAHRCLGAIDGPADDLADDSTYGGTLECGHCTLCGFAVQAVLPVSPAAAGHAAIARLPAALPAQAYRRSAARFRNPRAPPLRAFD
ncbi:hypothetical protein [Nisaea sp.]|uniref:hypothetical protein n=1 Tax=Nisaea sp. TaxID=2024842 RepID=UPI0032EC0E86